MGLWIRLLVVIFVSMTFAGSLAAAERAADRVGCGARVVVATASPDADTPSFDSARLLFCKIASSILPALTLPLRARGEVAAEAPGTSPLPSLSVAPRERPPRSKA